MDCKSVLLPVLLAPARMVSGAIERPVGAWTDLKLASFQYVIMRTLRLV